MMTSTSSRSILSGVGERSAGRELLRHCQTSPKPFKSVQRDIRARSVSNDEDLQLDRRSVLFAASAAALTLPQVSLAADGSELLPRPSKVPK